MQLSDEVHPMVSDMAHEPNTQTVRMRLKASTLADLRAMMETMGVRAYDPAISTAVDCWSALAELAELTACQSHVVLSREKGPPGHGRPPGPRR